jgi:hypothetical protein
MTLKLMVEFCYAECHFFLVSCMLSFTNKLSMLSVILLNAIMLSVAMLNVAMLNVIYTEYR